MTTSTFRSGFVAIVGRPNVGKSTLLNRLLGQKIAITSSRPQTTRNRILGIVSSDEGQILLLDTPGIHQGGGKLNRYMVDQAFSACSDVDLTLFVVEATAAPHPEDEALLEKLTSRGVPLYLLLNKVDQIPRETLLPLIEAYASRHNVAEIIPLSALTGEGTDTLVANVLAHLPEGPRYYPEDMVTDLPERFIVAEMIREQVLRQTRDEVPYNVAVAVEEFVEKPERDLVVIRAAVTVGRDSHKGILLGKRGSMVRSIGKAARHQIESFLGCRVFLEIFVKVEKNWTESERLLKEFGYHEKR
ncbi:MAG: GTPase Era [Desulfuromonas sp.]|nr:MAG: GTPase Era [Desulfuromonas sp.]